jgi:TRAP-type C4-dicarboxylate transport system substrate-binding protein
MAINQRIIGLAAMFFLTLISIGLDVRAEDKNNKNVVGPWDLEKYISGKETPPKDIVIMIKGASVAPEGSSWWNFLMGKMYPAFDKALNGHIKIKWYGGGVLGDETDTIRKMRMRQLQILGVTNMGFTKMVPEMCVLELPFLFDWEPDLIYSGKYTQVDYILEKIKPTVDKLSKKNGYALGGFLETCFDGLGTQIPIEKVEDLKQITFWFWRGDRIREEINKAYSLRTYPMELYDVAQALSTGMINSTFVGAYVAIVLQWWHHIKYFSNYPIYGYESATILLDNHLFDQMAPFFDKWGHLYGIKDGKDFRMKFLEIWDTYCTQLRFIVRKDEAKARARLTSEGIKEVVISDKELEMFKNKILPLYDELADKKYPKSLLDEILKYREEYRTLKKEGKLDDKWYDNGIMPSLGR